MALEIKCKLLNKLQVQRGNSARGAWSKQDFLVETIEAYPRKICMNVWGDDKVSELGGFNVGETLNISINIESREYNGRWYTDIRAWRIQRDGGADSPAEFPAGTETLANDPFIGAGEDAEGDLPF